MPVSISETKNIDLFRKSINRNFPTYGDELPDADRTEDGRLFVLTPGQTLYQLQDGAWVAL